MLPTRLQLLHRSPIESCEGSAAVVSVARAYPRQVEISRAFKAAKACGLDVAAVEIAPDGTIRMVEARAIERRDEFSQWEPRL